MGIRGIQCLHVLGRSQRLLTIQGTPQHLLLLWAKSIVVKEILALH